MQTVKQLRKKRGKEGGKEGRAKQERTTDTKTQKYAHGTHTHTHTHLRRLHLLADAATTLTAHPPRSSKKQQEW